MSDPTPPPTPPSDPDAAQRLADKNRKARGCCLGLIGLLVFGAVCFWLLPAQEQLYAAGGLAVLAVLYLAVPPLKKALPGMPALTALLAAAFAAWLGWAELEQAKRDAEALLQAEESLERARTALRAGDHQRALDDVEQALEEYPDGASERDAARDLKRELLADYAGPREVAVAQCVQAARRDLADGDLEGARGAMGFGPESSLPFDAELMRAAARVNALEDEAGWREFLSLDFELGLTINDHFEEFILATMDEATLDALQTGVPPSDRPELNEPNLEALWWRELGARPDLRQRWQSLHARLASEREGLLAAHPGAVDIPAAQWRDFAEDLTLHERRTRLSQAWSWRDLADANLSEFRFYDVDADGDLEGMALILADRQQFIDEENLRIAIGLLFLSFGTLQGKEPAPELAEVFMNALQFAPEASPKRYTAGGVTIKAQRIDFHGVDSVKLWIGAWPGELDTHLDSPHPLWWARPLAGN